MDPHRSLLSVLNLVFVVLLILASTESQHVSAAENDVKDMTAAWSKLFACNGKLDVSAGKRNAAMAALDGPIEYSFDAKLKEVGAYNFTFVNIDARGDAYQVHTVRVAVGKNHRNSKKMTVAPEGVANEATLHMQPNETVGVQWSYNPGGEGVPGGWILKTVTYGKVVSGVPGYEGLLSPQ